MEHPSSFSAASFIAIKMSAETSSGVTCFFCPITETSNWGLSFSSAEVGALWRARLCWTVENFYPISLFTLIIVLAWFL